MSFLSRGGGGGKLGESDRNNFIKRGNHKEFFDIRGGGGGEGTAKIEQSTIKTNLHHFLTAISDGNQKITADCDFIHYFLLNYKRAGLLQI